MQCGGGAATVQNGILTTIDSDLQGKVQLTTVAALQGLEIYGRQWSTDRGQEGRNAIVIAHSTATGHCTKYWPQQVGHTGRHHGIAPRADDNPQGVTCDSPPAPPRVCDRRRTLPRKTPDRLRASQGPASPIPTRRQQWTELRRTSAPISPRASPPRKCSGSFSRCGTKSGGFGGGWMT